jgi:hypothetical protein
MSGQQRIKKSPAQLVQDHWKFIQRITNDEDEAQELALYVLKKFEQFKPARAAFAVFIGMKLRELRQSPIRGLWLIPAGRKRADICLWTSQELTVTATMKRSRLASTILSPRRHHEMPLTFLPIWLSFFMNG